MKQIQGGVTAAKGFEAAGVEAAIKYQNRKDMALIVSKAPCTVAGTFTSNVVKAAPVLWDKQIVEHSAFAQAVVVNSGIANACTGKQGLDCCEAEAKCAGELLGVPTDAVLVASTGVIGMQIPVDKITAGIEKLVAAKADTLEAGSDAAHAIMTTDTISKEIAIETQIGGMRKHYFADEKAGGYHNHWIKLYSQQHTGNPYPTHGLGPVCQWMNIHRGDRMEYLVSMSSRQAGLSAYAGQVFGASSEEAAQSYEMGDVNTTLIHTAKGRTILLQYDVTTPRPYSRHQTVCGTKGFMQKYPVPCLLLDEYGKEPLSGEQFERMMEQYKHPFTAVIGEEARRKNMPNEMNYIMDYRLIHCLRNGLPLDQDVYDAAEWSCITELSERSVRQGSVPVEIPDFTRGNWKER